MAYKVLARFYRYPDQVGEAYCIVSDDADKDTRFKIGEKINIKLDKRNLTSQCNRPNDACPNYHESARTQRWSRCGYCGKDLSGR